MAAQDLLSQSHFEVDEATVSSLSTVQLLLASANPALATLVRQRAYSLFTTRKFIFDTNASEPSQDEYMLALDYSFALDDLTRLSPIQLLLVPFNPNATQQVAEQAYARFLAFGSGARHEQTLRVLDGADHPLLCLRAIGLSNTSGVNGSAETDQLELRVLQDCISVRRFAGPGLVVDECRFAGSAILDFCYIAGSPTTEGLPCTIQVKVDAHSRFNARHGPSTISVALGPLLTENPDFVLLRRVIREWSKRHSFVIRAEDAPSDVLPSPVKPVPKVDSPERKHPRAEPLEPLPSVGERRASKVPRRVSSRRTSRSPSPRRRESSSSHPALGSPSRPLPPSSRRSLSPQLHLATPPSPIFQYLSQQPNEVAWTPAYYTRQAALLRAIDMKADLFLPTFSHEDVVLLSYRPDASQLPHLDRTHDRSVRYSSEDRLAVERIYKDYGFIEIEQTRFLISCGGDVLPDLRRYVDLVAKIVKCRDTFATAWSSLKEVLATRRHDKKTQDPIESLVELADKLSKREQLRIELFTDGARMPATRNNLTAAEIGVGPWRRYDEALRGICEFEADARQRIRR